MRRIVCSLLALLATIAAAQDQPTFPAIDPATKQAWDEDYAKFAQRCDTAGFALDYPKTVRDLAEGDSKACVTALRVCRATLDMRCVPLVVDKLKSTDRDVSTWAAVALGQMVYDDAIARLRGNPLDQPVLAPAGASYVDLRPLRSVVSDMMRSGDVTKEGYGASLAGSIKLPELEPELRVLHGSRHPAVYRDVEWTFDKLGLKYTKRTPAG